MKALQILKDNWQEVLEGNESPFPLASEIKSIENWIKEVKGDLSDEIRYNIGEENSYSHQGIVFTKKNGGASYSFDNCQEIKKKKAELKQLEQDAKLNLSLMEKGKLNYILEGETMVDPETGEIIEVPQKKINRDSYTIKLK